MSDSKSTWSSRGFKLQRFGPGRNAIQSHHSNDLIEAANMLGNIAVKRGNSDKVLYAESGVVIQLKDFDDSASGDVQPFKIYQTTSWLTFKVMTGYVITTGNPIVPSMIETSFTLSSGVALYWFYVDMTATTAEIKTSSTTLPWSSSKIPIGWVDTSTGAASSASTISQFVRDHIFNPCAE